MFLYVLLERGQLGIRGGGMVGCVYYSPEGCMRVMNGKKKPLLEKNPNPRLNPIFLFYLLHIAYNPSVMTVYIHILLFFCSIADSLAS